MMTCNATSVAEKILSAVEDPVANRTNVNKTRHNDQPTDTKTEGMNLKIRLNTSSKKLDLILTNCFFDSTIVEGLVVPNNIGFKNF